jgi:DNA-binding NarL/FixJ family response regulator
VPSATPESEPQPELTRRELEILRLVAAGANTRAMADRLHVSSATVRNVQHILAKLGVHSRLEAAAYATRHRLL